MEEKDIELGTFDDGGSQESSPLVQTEEKEKGSCGKGSKSGEECSEKSALLDQEEAASQESPSQPVSLLKMAEEGHVEVAIEQIALEEAPSESKLSTSPKASPKQSPKLVAVVKPMVQESSSNEKEKKKSPRVSPRSPRAGENKQKSPSTPRGKSSPKSSNKGKKKMTREQLSLDIKSANTNPNLLQSTMSMPLSARTPKPINVQVFLKEGEGRMLMLERGKVTTAGEIRQMIMALLPLPQTSSHVFALWMISPHLEIQMKDHHIPYLIRRQWADLLKTFTDISSVEEATEDEPVIVFQRNSFLSVADERKIKDELVIKRLFEEARFNILHERYPVINSDLDMLGGLLARIDKGKYNPNIHKSGYFKSSLEEFLPPRVMGPRILKLVRTSSVENRLLQQYEHASNRAVDSMECRRIFLDYCQELPFYGCAFFRGTVENEQGDYMPWKSSHDQSVFVGINRSGITIFKHNRKEVLINLNFDQLSWDYIKSDDPDCTDSFCLEYDPPPGEAKEAGQAEQLQILSRQACMMDAMTDSCVQIMNRRNIPKTPTSADHSRLVEMGVPLSKNQLSFTLSNPFRFHTPR